MEKASTTFRRAWLRRIPSVEKLLASDLGRRISEQFPRTLVVGQVRSVLERTRRAIELAKRPDDIEPQLILPQHILGAVERALADSSRPAHRRAVNATGVILHTGLGRAPLAEAARRALLDAAGYVILEVDAETGERSNRDLEVEALLREITGAEAATVVNNNAAATLILLDTLASGRQVVLSRGQLVEIGGSFRLPEILEVSGARLVEVGTTNRTYLADYRTALTPEVAAILRVHTSNFRMHGYVADVPLSKLVRLAREHELPVIDDVGSGTLVDLAPLGFHEPYVRQSVEDGADAVCFSTDKLVGGPQGGAIVGRRAIIERIRRNPLARTVRVDKLSLAALAATLRIYLDPERAYREIPALKMLSRPLDDLERAARGLRDAIAPASTRLMVEIRDGQSQLGGGALPDENLPTRVVELASDVLSAGELAAALRRRDVPIFARVQRDRVLFDPRTLLDGDADEIASAIGDLLAH